jgi:hypothetical protein
MKSRQDQSATVIAKASLFGAFAFVSVASAPKMSAPDFPIRRRSSLSTGTLRLGPERVSRRRRQ